MGIPMVEEFMVPGIQVWLTDHVAASKNTQHAAARIASNVLQRNHLDKYRAGTYLCDGQVEQRASDLYMLENQGRTEEQGDLDFEQFVSDNANSIFVDEACQDWRLDIKTFIVTDENRDLLGNFILYNVVTERQRPERRVVTAMPMPGCRRAPGFTLRRTWHRIMRYILENELVMTKKNLDVIAWRFPQRVDQQWIVKPGEIGKEGDEEGDVMWARVITDLSDHTLTKEGEVPKEIRRKPARGR